MEEMDVDNFCWRLLPFIAILLVGVALLFPACSDPTGSRDLWERLERQSGGASP